MEEIVYQFTITTPHQKRIKRWRKQIKNTTQ